MQALGFPRPAGRPLRVLALGAHADDIEIGCGATLLHLVATEPGLEVCWAVVAGEDEGRREEATASAAELAEGAGDLQVALGDFRDGWLPYAGGAVKEWVHELRERLDPDVVLTHQPADLHQDHRLLAELALNAFRDHLILGFEIPKYDGDLGAPNLYVHADEATCARKIDIIRRHFRSQHDKPWFDDDVFRALMRLRGIESRAPSGYAEAFYARKLVLGHQ